MKRVFVSHATVDVDLVSEFVDVLLTGCGLSEDDIFVSSMPGMGVAAGKDLLADVRSHVSDTTLVIAVVSKTYPTRPVCVAELGAAWGVSGKLHPILVPGVDRAALDGVLQGVKADYLDEHHALDELQQRIEDVTGVRPTSSTSWTRHKRRWLSRVHDLSTALPEPAVVRAEELDEMKAHLAETVAALVEAENEVQRLERQVEALKMAKDRDEVREILLPSDDIERFQVLRRDARTALENVSRAVREGVRLRIAREPFYRPSSFTDPDMAQAVDEAIDDGHLTDQGDRVALNDEFGPVKRAMTATARLAEALDEGHFDGDFYEWFAEEFDGPPELGRGAIWSKVFPRL